MSLVVHPHFHSRRSGVSRHVEAIVPGLSRSIDTRGLGKWLDPIVPRIGWRELWRRIRKESVVWHAHRNKELALGLLLRWVGRHVRLVFSRHTATPPGWLTRTLARRADFRVSLTQDMAESVPWPSTVVAHGADLRRFQPPADRSAAWRGLGLGGDYGIAVLGRVRPQKGPADFVDALVDLVKDNVQWHAALVGRVKPAQKPFADEIRARAQGRLAFVGEQWDVEKWYQALTIVVQPSHSEGFSVVPLEAMACGCCVVATALPYAKYLIEHGRTGFLYEPGNAQHLREVLEPLLKEPKRAQAVGMAAAEETQGRLKVDHEVQRLLDIYQPLLSAP